MTFVTCAAPSRSAAKMAAAAAPSSRSGAGTGGCTSVTCPRSWTSISSAHWRTAVHCSRSAAAATREEGAAIRTATSNGRSCAISRTARSNQAVSEAVTPATMAADDSTRPRATSSAGDCVWLTRMTLAVAPAGAADSASTRRMSNGPSSPGLWMRASYSGAYSDRTSASSHEGLRAPKATPIRRGQRQENRRGGRFHMHGTSRYAPTVSISQSRRASSGSAT